MTAWVCFGFLLVYASAMRLRYAPPFRNLFHETCIVIAQEEVVPTLAIFLIAICSVTFCCYVLCCRSATLRRVMFGLLVAAISFTIGVFVA